MFLLDSSEPKLSQKKLENFYAIDDNSALNTMANSTEIDGKSPTGSSFMKTTSKVIKKKEKKDKNNKKEKVLKVHKEKAKEISLSEQEQDCLSLVKTYFKSGQYAHDLFFRVSSNVWKHYEIHSVSMQNYIVQTAKREVNFQKDDEENS